MSFDKILMALDNSFTFVLASKGNTVCNILHLILLKSNSAWRRSLTAKNLFNYYDSDEGFFSPILLVNYRVNALI
jgi:hypothetical protein